MLKLCKFPFYLFCTIIPQQAFWYNIKHTTSLLIWIPHKPFDISRAVICPLRVTPPICHLFLPYLWCRWFSFHFQHSRCRCWCQSLQRPPVWSLETSWWPWHGQCDITWSAWPTVNRFQLSSNLIVSFTGAFGFNSNCENETSSAVHGVTTNTLTQFQEITGYWNNTRKAVQDGLWGVSACFVSGKLPF